MSAGWLGYPQAVLAVWGPLTVVAAWTAARPLLRRLPPQVRFRVAVVTSLTPVLALCVPYLPDSPLRGALPWRAPVAWGISTPVEGTPGTAASGVLHVLMELLVLGVLGSLAVSAAVTAVSVIRLRLWVRRMRPRREGDLSVVRTGDAVACTVGLLRPRVVVSRAVLDSPHAAAVLAHERAHVAARHPLWIALATTVLRGWWWIPGRRALLGELALCAELAADAGARGAVGSPAVARALRDHLPAAATGLGPVVQPVGFDPHVELVERAVALTRSARWLSVPASVGVHVVLLAAVSAVVVLF